MAPLTLTSAYTANETSISNVFLDTYMPSANGDFVKVYLCLLRLFKDPNHKPATISDIADSLNNTENDVIRALRYWEKMGLLDITYNSDNIPCGITLLPIGQEEAHISIDKRSKADFIEDIEETVAPAKEPKKVAPPRRNTSAAPVFDEDLKSILFVSQQLLGKQLSSKDVDTLTYIYSELGFTEELIEYLLEYCITNEKKSLRYIETVAINWHEEGITTVDDAKNHHEIYRHNIFAVMKALGINDHNPTNAEAKIINKWYDEYKFSSELIIEACERTIKAIHKPSFDYVETILADWKKKNVTSLEDLPALDAARTKKIYTTANAVRSTTQTAAKTRKNGPNTDIEHRDYDFVALEKRFATRKGDNN